MECMMHSPVPVFAKSGTGTDNPGEQPDKTEPGGRLTGVKRVVAIS